MNNMIDVTINETASKQQNYTNTKLYGKLEYNEFCEI